jgi:TonB family protein
MKSPRFNLRMVSVAASALFICFASAQAHIAYGQDARPQPPRIIRKSGGVLSGEAINKPAPVYPPLAKAAKVSGSVVVEVTIDEVGNVISARALSGHPLLKDAAVGAAQQWTFKPTYLSGVPVKVIGTITFNFNMDYSKDIEALKEQIAANPNDAILHQRLGALYNADGQHAKAVEEYKQALAIEPNGKGISAYFGLASAYEKLGQLDEAIQAYRQWLSIKTDTNDTEQAYIRLGAIYLQQGRDNEALEALKQAVTINPYSQEAHFNLGLAYAKTGDKQAATQEYEILKKMGSPYAGTVLNSIRKDQ